MAARRGKVAISITADPSGLDKGLRQAEGDLSRFGDRGSKSLGALKGAAITAGAAITTGLVYGLKESVEAAVEAEKAQRSMEAQLKAMGTSYAAHAGHIENVIQKTSRLAGLDDEELQGAFTRLVRASGSVNKSLEQMGLVADIARARNIDVAKAGDLVAKVMSGNTSALSRYGLKVKDGATAQEALAEAQKKFSGQAEAYGKTAAGAQDRFKVALENLKETIGEKVLPVLTPLAEKAAKFVEQMQNGKGAGGEFVKTLKDIADKVRPIVEFFTKHPKYIAVAVGAWAAYKAAAKGAAIYTKIQMLSAFRGQALAQQKAAATAAGASVGTAYGGKAGMGGKLMTAMRGLGWAALGYEIARLLGLDKHISDQIDEALGKTPTKLEQTLRDFVVSHGLTNTTPTVGAVAGGVGSVTGGSSARRGLAGKSARDSGSGPVASASSFNDPGASGNSGGSQKPSSKPRPSGSSSAPSSSGGSSSGGTTTTASGGGYYGAPSAGANTGIIALGRQLQAEGYLVAEHPAFPPYSPGAHSPTGNHPKGLAIDVNGGPGGEPGSLDALYARLRGRPGVIELLWRVADHYDHLHVAVAGSANPLTGASAPGGSPTTTGTTSYAASAGYTPPKKTPFEKVSGALELIGLRERAGIIGAGRADKATVKTINRALGGAFGGLGERDRLELMGTRREARAEIRERQQARRSKSRDRERDAPGKKLRSVIQFLRFAAQAGSISQREFRSRAITELQAGLDGKYGTLKPADRQWARQKIRELRGPTDIGEAVSEVYDPASFSQTPFDDAALAEAGLTAATADDLSVLQGRLGIAERELGSARSSNDREGIAQWASIVGSLRSEISGLSEAVSENTAQLAEMHRQSAEQWQRMYNTSQAQYDVFKRAIADMVSGELGGRVGLGFQSAGVAGQLARY